MMCPDEYISLTRPHVTEFGIEYQFEILWLETNVYSLVWYSDDGSFERKHKKRIGCHVLVFPPSTHEQHGVFINSVAVLGHFLKCTNRGIPNRVLGVEFGEGRKALEIPVAKTRKIAFTAGRFVAGEAIFSSVRCYFPPCAGQTDSFQVYTAHRRMLMIFIECRGWVMAALNLTVGYTFPDLKTNPASLWECFGTNQRNLMKLGSYLGGA